MHVAVIFWEPTLAAHIDQRINYVTFVQTQGIQKWDKDIETDAERKIKELRNEREGPNPLYHSAFIKKFQREKVTYSPI